MESDDINVIILDNVEHQQEDLVECYYDLIKSCKKSSEVKTTLRMLLQENRELTLREVLIKDIKNKAKILEDTKRD